MRAAVLLVVLAGCASVPPPAEHVDVDALVEQGVAAVASEHYSEGVRFLTKALQVAQLDPRPWAERALARAGLGDQVGARSDAERALALVEQRWSDRDVPATDVDALLETITTIEHVLVPNARILRWRAMLRANRSLDEGILDLSSSIARFPLDARLLVARGDLLRRKGEWNLAVLDYEHAVEADPRSAQAWEAHGKMLAEAGDAQRAIEDFNKALDLDSTCFWALVERAELRFKGRDYQAAEDDLTAALAIDNKKGTPWFDRSLTRYCLRRLDDAYSDVTRALELWPSEAFVLRRRARILLELDRSA
ncbi:MAG TPA: tetratricopeptide repeat protein, partial [Planctomycetota bacterium]|nr:tetratricopeptide repeat protein [Planctomycetota bacterium]